MSVVAEELQLEREPQYREKIMPEAQLLEHPLNIIDGLQQAAQEGIVPQVADAISLAHLPSPGFKITHEINPNAQIEPNDGKAAIVAGICGVTRSCEDRCCPIGDLEKARVRVGLINDLKLNDPDFFNNPNAEKIIKDRVNEIMEQKQQITNAEGPASQDAAANTPTAEKKKTKPEIPTGFFGKQLSPEEAKQKMEELSGTYSQGKKISSPEPTLQSNTSQNTERVIPAHLQKMLREKAQQTTTSQTVESPQSEKTVINTSKPVEIKVEQPAQTEPVAIIQQKHETPTPKIETPQEQKPKVPDHIREMMQAQIKRPVENAPLQAENSQKPFEKPVSSSQPAIEQQVSIPTAPQELPEIKATRQEANTPVVPQERIERHRTKIEPSKQSVEQTVKQPISEKPQSADREEPIESIQSAPLQESDSNREKIENNAESPKPKNNKPLEQTIQAEPPIIKPDLDIQMPQREINTVQFETPKPKQQKIDTQLNESVMQIPVDIMQKITSQNQEMKQPEPQQVQQIAHESNMLHTEQTIQIPKFETPQIPQKDFMPEMTTIRFIQESVIHENNSVTSSLESIQTTPRIAEINSTDEQEIQQKDQISHEIPVKTVTSPVIEGTNTESTPVKDSLVNPEIPPVQIKVEPPQKTETGLQEVPQIVSINLQEIHNQTIIETTIAEETKIQPQQIEIQSANPVSINNEISEVVKDTFEEQINEIKVTETQQVMMETINEPKNTTEQVQVEVTQEIIDTKPSVENPVEQSEIIVEPATENALEQLLTVILENSDVQLIESQEQQPEVREAQELPTDEIITFEDSQVLMPNETIVAMTEPHLTTENGMTELPEMLDRSINQESSTLEFTEEQPIITLETTQNQLAQVIAETLSETEVEEKPVLILAIPENNDVIDPVVETISEVSAESINDNGNIEEIPQQEIFTIQLLNQEQVFDFMQVIQNITELLSFFHEQNQQDDSFIDIDNTKEMDVTQEELKNDTFGQYDDTVVATLFPIIQFMLFFQRLQIFLPSQKRHPVRQLADVSESLNLS